MPAPPITQPAVAAGPLGWTCRARLDAGSVTRPSPRDLLARALDLESVRNAIVIMFAKLYLLSTCQSEIAINPPPKKKKIENGEIKFLTIEKKNTLVTRPGRAHRDGKMLEPACVTNRPLTPTSKC